jgi:hypothetical protein
LEHDQEISDTPAKMGGYVATAGDVRLIYNCGAYQENLAEMILLRTTDGQKNLFDLWQQVYSVNHLCSPFSDVFA